MQTKKLKIITRQQQKSLHLYFQLIAEQLNDAGLEIHTVLKSGIDIPWNAVLVKELLWRTIQKMQLGKQSTTQLTTSDIDKVFDTFNRFIASHGIEQEFPSIDSLINKYENFNNK